MLYMAEFIRNSPKELAKRIARNPAILLRVPEKLSDIHKWRKINHVLDEYEATHPAARFAQIGANDGVRGDPIHKRVVAGEWTGVLVEPIKEHIDEARKNYLGIPGIRFVRAAITDHDGTADMYRFRHEEHNGVGIESHSLDFSAVAKSAKLLGASAMGEWVEQVEVPTMTLASLVEAEALGDIDLLAIDAEGSDELILHSLLETPLRPPLILYENLFMADANQAAINSKFGHEAYEAIVTSQDTLLYRP
jgi:FkbM family methyltransferase